MLDGSGGRARTTYYFYAKHASRYSAEWELKLLRETAIESCGK